MGNLGQYTGRIPFSSSATPPSPSTPTVSITTLITAANKKGIPTSSSMAPLTATLLLDLFSQQFPGRALASFNYRGVSPLFHPHTFTVNGRADGTAWAASHNGRLAMRAQVSFADPTG